jgi:hypothetical protein
MTYCLLHVPWLDARGIKMDDSVCVYYSSTYYDDMSYGCSLWESILKRLNLILWQILPLFCHPIKPPGI